MEGASHFYGNSAQSINIKKKNVEENLMIACRALFMSVYAQI